MDLSIRPVENADLEDIARLANNIDVAEMTAALPYPYTKEHAKTWLQYIEHKNNEYIFALCGNHQFMGVVGLIHEAEHERAELGYWLGQPYWNKGHMTGAVGIAVEYAFTMLKVKRIYAQCFAQNAASKRVLEKNGFLLEGCLKKHFIRMGKQRDILCYGLLKQ